MTGECIWKSVGWDVVQIKNEGLSWMGICPGDYPHVLYFFNTLDLLHSVFDLCQGPSHGGSYMDKGTFHIRI